MYYWVGVIFIGRVKVKKYCKVIVKLKIMLLWVKYINNGY